MGQQAVICLSAAPRHNEGNRAREGVGAGGWRGEGREGGRLGEKAKERARGQSAAIRSTDLELERMQPVVLNLDFANDPQPPLILVDDAKHQVPVPVCVVHTPVSADCLLAWLIFKSLELIDWMHDAREGISGMQDEGGGAGGRRFTPQLGPSCRRQTCS